MKTIEIVYVILFSISVILIYFGLKNYYKTKYLLTTGLRTKATVIDLIVVSGDDGDTYKPIFEYTNSKNKLISFKSDVSSSPPAYSVGEIVNIIYSKDNEERKVVSFWGLYRWTIILLAIASPILIISGGYLLYIKGIL
jgi:hypothetical protein